MSELGRLRSHVRDIPDDDDMKATDVQVEDTKTHTFGRAYFVSDPEES